MFNIMDQRVSLITLGVADLEQSVRFYRDLGWTVGNDWRSQGVAFFQCVGMVFALWNSQELARDSGTVAHPPGAVTLAHNVRSEDEVATMLEQARAAGAHIARPGAPTGWGGYSGVFHDLDGHAWEIAVNPMWTVSADGATHMATHKHR